MQPDLQLSSDKSDERCHSLASDCSPVQAVLNSDLRQGTIRFEPRLLCLLYTLKEETDPAVMQEHELPTSGGLYALSEACMQATANIEGGGSEGYLLRSTTTSVSFPGYLAVYPPRTSAGLLTGYLVYSQPVQAITNCSFPPQLAISMLKDTYIRALSLHTVPVL